jgi:hypothetical protein
MMTSIVAFVADLAEIVGVGLALYVFFAKRTEIRAAFGLLLSYSYQLTFSELRSKLDRAADLRATDPEEREEIKAIMNDIAGQLRGSRILRRPCADLVQRLEEYTGKGKNPEPLKRNLLAEVRERLRHIDTDVAYDSQE